MSANERESAGAIKLRGDARLPLIGFGTWQIEGELARTSVIDALEVGYRHIDTATVYGNEHEVGRAIAASGLDREELFITTKLPGDARNVRETIDRSLAALGLEYVDLWLIHWPPARSYGDSVHPSTALYEEMLSVRDDGLVRAVGVSNYSIEEIDELITAAGEAPEVNQIPWSPFAHDPSLHTELRTRKICLEGYSPLATSRLDHPVLRELAETYRVTPAQVVLRWHLEHDVVVIPKSIRHERIRENFDIVDFSLSADAISRIDALAST